MVDVDDVLLNDMEAARLDPSAFNMGNDGITHVCITIKNKIMVRNFYKRNNSYNNELIHTANIKSNEKQN